MSVTKVDLINEQERHAKTRAELAKARAEIVRLKADVAKKATVVQAVAPVVDTAATQEVDRIKREVRAAKVSIAKMVRAIETANKRLVKRGGATVEIE